MQVEATRVGYYGLKRRKVGEAFVIDSPAHFSKKWMKSLEPTPVEQQQEVAAETGAEPKAEKPAASPKPKTAPKPKAAAKPKAEPKDEPKADAV